MIVQFLVPSSMEYVIGGDKVDHVGGSITDRQHRIGTFSRRH